MSSTATLPQTLDQRLAEGQLTVPASLGIGTQLAEALRRLHDGGQIHGAVSPTSVILAADGVELTPAVPCEEPTPYTAPEVVAGKTADVASDIFSYGAVLYEMLTGRRAFDGAGSAAIAAAVTQAQPAPTGNPAVDRLLAACLAKDPAARPGRVQKVVLDLKVLTMTAELARQRGSRNDAALPPSLRAEMADLEARLNRRLESDRQDVARLHRETAGALSELRAELGGIAGQLSAQQEQLTRFQREADAARENLIGHIQQHLDASAEHIQDLKQNLAAGQARVEKLEESALNRGHLDQIGLNLEAQAARMQEVEAAITATHGVIEHLDRSAANRDEVDQIAQIVETERDRTANMVAILTGLMSDFEQHKKSAVSHEQLAQLARQVEAQSARIDGVEKAGAANPQSEAADVNERIAELHKLISDNAQNLESAIQQQAGSVQSLRGAIAQTDDTVERVIEALESLQESIIEHNTNGRDG